MAKIEYQLTNPRQRFGDDGLIFVPARDQSEEEAPWTYPYGCVWTAPVRHLNTTFALDELYARRPGEPASSSGGYGLEHFFRNIVRVPKWNWSHAIDEIKFQKSVDANFDCIIELYKCLAKSKLSKQVAEDIRYVQPFSPTYMGLISKMRLANWGQTCL